MSMPFQHSHTPASGASEALGIPAGSASDADLAEVPKAQAAVIRLVIVEDDEALLDSLARIMALQPDISIIGSYQPVGFEVFL
jgi:hypothetical protein